MRQQLDDDRAHPFFPEGRGATTWLMILALMLHLCALPR